MRFYTFVIKKYLNDSSYKGVLARSMKQDAFNFPKTRVNYRSVKGYLEQSRISDNCMDAFKECWDEWKECEKKK